MARRNLRALFRSLTLMTLVSGAALGVTNAWADRIKDIVSVAGVRSNQLIGYGLVVGLQGTGDGQDISFTKQSLKAMLDRLGVTVDSPLSDYDEAGRGGGSLDLKNVAAVMVTADLPAFAKPGQRIDINLSTIGKATSLRGGSLILTRLRGADGQVYALAQGALTVTGVDVSAAGSRVAVGVPTAGRIPGGASVERMVETPFNKTDHLVLNVRESDFSTVTAIVEAINGKFGAGVARAVDGVSLMVDAPRDPGQRVQFLSLIENLRIEPPEPVARVVINSRTGTVVISRNVRVTAAAVTHGTISVTISATNEVSQPNPLSGGQTVGVTNADIAVSEGDPKTNPMFLFQPGVDLRAVVDAVNQIGATPSALIAILEALKSSGSLRAELLVI